MFRNRFLARFQPKMEADGGGAGAGTSTIGESAGTGNGASTGNAAGAAQQSATFDYEKIKSIVEGAQSVKEDAVLKNYFKQQGLSQEELAQAIASFKEQKARNQPDVGVLQQQAAQAAVEVKQAQIEKAAVLAAIGLGIDAKTIPYVLKMADLSSVMDQENKVNTEALTKALGKVLEDVPALKPAAVSGTGFVQVGATGSNQQQAANQDALKAAFGLQ